MTHPLNLTSDEYEDWDLGEACSLDDDEECESCQ